MYSAVLIFFNAYKFTVCTNLFTFNFNKSVFSRKIHFCKLFWFYKTHFCNVGWNIKSFRFKNSSNFKIISKNNFAGVVLGNRMGSKEKTMGPRMNILEMMADRG